MNIDKYRKLKYAMMNNNSKVSLKKGTICYIIGEDNLDRLILSPINKELIIMHIYENDLEKITLDELMVELL